MYFTIMRKFSYLTFIGLLFFASCGSNPAEIEVASLETLCDHVDALGEVYDRMEEIMDVTFMDAKNGNGTYSNQYYNEMIYESEELMALFEKAEEIKYSMFNNTFEFKERLFKACPNGEEYYPWLDN